MKNLVIIGHPDKNSFCYNGIYKTIKKEMLKSYDQLRNILGNSGASKETALKIYNYYFDSNS